MTFPGQPCKNTMRLKVLAARPLEAAQSVDADGFTVIEDAEVALASKGDSKLPMRLRRIIVEREDARGGAKRRITPHCQRHAPRRP